MRYVILLKSACPTFDQRQLLERLVVITGFVLAVLGDKQKQETI